MHLHRPVKYLLICVCVSIDGIISSELQCVAHNCLQSVVVCCSLLQSVAVCCSLLQSVAVCCSLLQSVAHHRQNDLFMICMPRHFLWRGRRDGKQCKYLECVPYIHRSMSYVSRICCSVLQCVAVCCSALQCVAVRCSVLQRVAESYMSCTSDASRAH